ncbi:hypothetical protein GBAR_LOCUS17950 [Geodia barretti]|nr:hypothetical protein GBAR_LOCUS17950 [Geodia barretti]
MAHREWKGSCWTLTPVVPPPPQSSSLQLRSPELSEILRRLVPGARSDCSQLGYLDKSSSIVGGPSCTSGGQAPLNRTMTPSLPPSSLPSLPSEKTDAPQTVPDVYFGECLTGTQRQSSSGGVTLTPGCYSHQQSHSRPVDAAKELDKPLTSDTSGRWYRRSSAGPTESGRQGNGVEMVQTRLMAKQDGSLLLSKVRGVAAEKNAPQRRLDGELKTTDATGARNQIWSDVRCMDGSDLSAAEPQLGTAAECAMVLIFADQSSQLREQKAKPTKQVTEIDGVCVAVAGEESSSLDFFFLPLDPKNQSLDEWCKKQLLHLLLHTRVICYNAQEILTTLINHYQTALFS